MQKLNRLRCLPFVILLCLLIEACATPPNVYVFENLQQHLATDPVTTHLILTPSPTCMAQIGEVECGHGVSIISGDEIFIGELPTHLFNGKTWGAIKSESVYVPAVESYAPLSSYMIDACKKMNCSDQVDAFKLKINPLNVILK